MDEGLKSDDGDRRALHVALVDEPFDDFADFGVKPVVAIAFGVVAFDEAADMGVAAEFLLPAPDGSPVGGNRIVDAAGGCEDGGVH